MQVATLVLPNRGLAPGSLCWIWDCMARHAAVHMGAELVLLLGELLAQWPPTQSAHGTIMHDGSMLPYAATWQAVIDCLHWPSY